MSARAVREVGVPPRWDWLWPGLAAMATYACMYAFRKPFAAGTYAGEDVAGMDYKIWLVVAQTLGYACSKFIGIGVIGQLLPAQRQPLLLAILGGALLAWLGFALTPAAWRALWLFCNGLLLGLVWGVVFSYLEGRRATEVMAALLASSVIFSSAMVKAVGKQLLLVDLEARWMPLACAALFSLPLLLCLRQLARLPPPDAGDRQARHARRPLGRARRRGLLRRFLPGLAALSVGYVAIAVLRDVRDNFEAELLTEAGHGGNAGLFLWIELPATLAALGVAAVLVRMHDHARCLWRLHLLMLAGLGGALLCTWLFRAGGLPALAWIALTGLCLALAYVPFNCAFFERFIAAFRLRGNVGFFAYLLDTLAYFASCGVLLAGHWMPSAGWTGRYVLASSALPLAGIAGTTLALCFFRRCHRAVRPPPVFHPSREFP